MVNTPPGPARDALQDEYSDLDAEIEGKAASIRQNSLSKRRKRRELAGELLDNPLGEETQEEASIMPSVPKADETPEGGVDAMRREGGAETVLLGQAAKGKAGWRRMKQTVEVALAPSPSEDPGQGTPF